MNIMIDDVSTIEKVEESNATVAPSVNQNQKSEKNQMSVEPVKPNEAVVSEESNSVKNNESAKKNNVPKKETLKPREQEIQDKVKLLTNDDKKNLLHSIVVRIELAKELVEAKKELKKRFYNVIDEDIAPKKFVERAMKLVLVKDVDFKDAMNIKDGKKDIERRVKKLKLDERIVNLTIDEMKDFNKPSLKKLEEIKNLSNEDFNEVISGLDKPYNDYKKKIAEKIASDKLTNHYSNRPSSMKKEDFDDYCKKGIYTVISLFSEAIDENEQIRKELKIKNDELTDANKKFTELTLKSKTEKTSSKVINSDISMSSEGVA